MAEQEKQVEKNKERKNKKKYPAKLSAREMKKFGVEVVTVLRRALRCCQCGMIWEPTYRGIGKLAPHYYDCPNGCNRNAGSVR